MSVQQAPRLQLSEAVALNHIRSAAEQGVTNKHDRTEGGCYDITALSVNDAVIRFRNNTPVSVDPPK